MPEIFDREPAVVSGAVASLITATVSLVALFGFDVDPQPVVAAVSAVIAAVWAVVAVVRPRVTPIAKG